MGQLEKYGLYVLCLVIFMILGVALWGDPATAGQRGNGRETARLSAQQTGDPKTAKQPAVPGVDLDALFNPQGGGAQNKPGDVKPAPRTDAPGPTGAPGNAAPVGKPETPVAAPDTKRPTYAIKAGDSFDSIARTQLKDASLRDLVMQLNPDVLPTRMKLGKEIVLPSPAEIAALKAPAAKEITTAKVEAKADRKAVVDKPIAPLADAERAYTVQKGDTFERIAFVELGSKKRTKELMDLNPGVKAESLRKGQRIKLPKK